MEIVVRVMEVGVRMGVNGLSKYGVYQKWFSRTCRRYLSLAL
jgi:uncharacterized protein YodC (DUF2158 family)